MNVRELREALATFDADCPVLLGLDFGDGDVGWLAPAEPPITWPAEPGWCVLLAGVLLEPAADELLDELRMREHQMPPWQTPEALGTEEAT